MCFLERKYLLKYSETEDMILINLLVLKEKETEGGRMRDRRERGRGENGKVNVAK